MLLSVDLLLPIITVFATLRLQVTNWFRFRAVSRPAHDITVGTPVEFDDLTSESNKEEVRQHDYYDRRKETFNQKVRKYTVAADDPDNVHKDQYTNEALETLFSQAVEAGKGLESLFAKSSKNEAKDTAVDDSKDENAKDTAAESADKLMFPREAEARELYKLYEMPPKPPKNNDQISFPSTDSLDSRVRLPWRQWINHLRSKTFSGLRNLFRRHAKTCKEKPKLKTTGKETGRTGSEETKRNSAESKAEGNTSKTKSKNPLRKLVTKRRRQQKLSVEQTDAMTKDDDKTNNVLAENNQEKVKTQPLITPASMYGPSAMPLPTCAWGHDDCDYIQEKRKMFGSLASHDHQPSHSVEPVQRISKLRSQGTNGPIPTPKKAKKGKRLAWFTSRSKKSSEQSEMTVTTNRPVGRKDVQVTGSSMACGSGGVENMSDAEFSTDKERNCGIKEGKGRGKRK